MNQIVEYIKKEIGIDVEISPFDTYNAKDFPTFLTSTYTFYKGVISGNSVVFARLKSENILAPSNYAKHEKIVKRTCQCPVIFVFDKIQSYNKARIISLGINFIVLGSQIYMPELFIILSNKGSVARHNNPSKYLTPTAQEILLLYFYENANKFSYKQIQDALVMPYPTVCRAIEQLESLGVCQVLGSRNKVVCFEENKRNLLENVLPLMKSPVKRVIYATQYPPNAHKSGITALSEYSMISPDEYEYAAISYEDYKKLESFSDEDDNLPVHIEVWNYNPDLFAKNGIVDKISLYLSLKDTYNERIQYELKQMIQQLW
jgi:hypothetical protein